MSKWSVDTASYYFLKLYWNQRACSLSWDGMVVNTKFENVPTLVRFSLARDDAKSDFGRSPATVKKSIFTLSFFQYYACANITNILM
jgi:hypothetical protein